MKPETNVRRPRTALALVLSCLATAPITAAVLGVPADHATIQGALDAAADGDTVVVAAGEYEITEPLDFNRLHVPDDPLSPPRKDLTLVSESGAESTVIRMAATPDDSDRASVVVFARGETTASVIEGFTLTGGQGLAVEDCSEGCFVQIFGGGIHIRGTAAPRFVDCAIRDNRSRLPFVDANGGGAWIEGEAEPVFERCTFENNRAGSGGGVSVAPGAAPRFMSCTFRGNVAAWGGGGAFLNQGARAEFSDCVLVANSADTGGGLLVHSSESSVRHTTITGNRALRDGGGVSAQNTAFLLEDSILWDNIGGSLSVSGIIEPRVRFCDVQGSWPGQGNINADPLFCGWSSGGEVWVDAASPPGGDGSEASPFQTLADALDFHLELAASSPCLGKASDGSAMGADTGTCAGTPITSREIHVAAGRYSIATINLHGNASIDGASADETVLEGSVVGLRTGSHLRDVTVEALTDIGVQIDSGESPTVSDCTIRRCANGAVFIAGGSPVFERCTITANRSDRWDRAGGITCAGAGRAVFRDSVISDNRSINIGAAIYTSEVGARPLLEHCTVTGNWGQQGPVVYTQAGDIELESCIVWRNEPASIGENIHGNGDVTARRSCVEGGWPGTGNTDTDPRFCSWEASEVFVDAAAAPGGDGSVESPFADLASALVDFQLSLASDSPCLGTGIDGSDRGAPFGSCESAGSASRIVTIAAGEYTLEGTLFHDASLVGAGAESTAVHGLVAGIQSDALLRDLTLTGGDEGVIVVGPGKAPRVERCVLEPHSNWPAVRCMANSRPELEDCEIRGGAGAYSVALEALGSAAPLLRRCAVRGLNGTGFSVRGASLRVEDSVIEGNSGSVLTASDGATTTWTDCAIAGNFQLGGGLFNLWQNASAAVVRTTFARNDGVQPGLFSLRDSALTLESSIVWDNGGALVPTEQDPKSIRATYSCIEGETVHPGTGNILAPPLLCGWGNEADVFVEPEVEGDSAADDEQNLAEAFAYSLSLAEGSPCIGTGSGGVDMGRASEHCSAPGVPHRTVHLAAGAYNAAGVSLAGGASLVGDGAEVVRVRGTLIGAGAETLVQGVTLFGGGGGGVLIGANRTPTFESCVVTESAGVGVLLGSGSDLVLRDCVVSSHAQNGILCNPDSVLLVEQSTVEDNREAGVLLANGAKATIRASLLARNEGFRFHGEVIGGGVFLEGPASARVEECSFLENLGAGARANFQGELTLVNCEIAGTRGPGVEATDTDVVLVNCTVADNFWSGLWSTNARWTLLNTIVWSNDAGNIFTPEWDENTKVTASWSTVGGDKVLPGEGNQNTDPLFVHEGVFDDGGTPLNPDDDVWSPGDYHLRSGSPAIDSATAEGAPELDLSGRTRPCGDGWDRGAYEHCAGSIAPFQRGDSNVDGNTNVSDAVFTLEWLFAGGASGTCEKAADANDSGAIDVSDPVYLLNWLFAGNAEPPPPLRECGDDLTPDDLDCVEFSPCS